jgi:hypothetical protein
MSGRRHVVSAWVALAMCLVTAVFWVRSYFDYDLFFFQSQPAPAMLTSIASAQFVAGELELMLNTGVLSSAQTNTGLHWISVSDRYYGPAGGDIWSSLIDFDLIAGRGQWLPGNLGTASRTVGVNVPVWFVGALWLIWPASLILVHRRKLRWRIREDIPWKNLRLSRRVKRFMIFSLAGIASGVALAVMNCLSTWWQLNWLTELLILLVGVTALTAATRRRIPWRRGLLWMTLELAGYVCLLAATVENSWHFFGGYWQNTPDLLQMVLILWLMAVGSGSAILLLLQMRPVKVKLGPYCPECGYCLIGSPRQICSECGRPFTFEELGIAPDGLIPPSVSPA